MDTLTRHGVVLAFEDVGKGAPPILLIHDLGGDHTMMRGQLTHLRGRHRVVAVDLRGHGQSDEVGRPHSPAGFVDDLVWLCYELGVYQPVAVGRGAGGVIAAEIEARRPDLLAGLVRVDSDAADEQVNEEIDALLATRAAEAHAQAIAIATAATEGEHGRVGQRPGNGGPDRDCQRIVSLPFVRGPRG